MSDSLSNDQPSSTPRTDAVAWTDYTSTKGYRSTEEIVTADFARELERALRELVRLKALHDEFERTNPPADEALYEKWWMLKIEYDRCKPLAWEAARNTLGIDQ